MPWSRSHNGGLHKRKMMSKMNRVTIVGAGLSGPLLALFMARRGFDVAVYETRNDPRQESASQEKSINLTISGK